MNPIVGITLKLTSTASFAMMSALVKELSVRYPIGEVVFCRAFFALIPLVIWLSWRGEFPTAIRTNNLVGHLRRCGVGTTGMFLGFLALSVLPLTDAVAIGYAAPLITVVLAALVLKETIRIYRWSAAVLGLAGVLVMLAPHLGVGNPGAVATSGAAMGALAAILGACCSAWATIEIRRLTATETTGAIVFYFMAFTALAGLTTMFFYQSVMPDAQDAALLILMGILGGIGQILMTQSFRYADASLIAPFEYTSMIWAVLLGWFLFSQFPSTWVVVGASIVTLSGIFVIWRERQLGIERARAAEAGSPRNT